jgi:hypothetical protein
MCYARTPIFFIYQIHCLSSFAAPYTLPTRARCTTPYPLPTYDPVLQYHLYSEIAALRQVKGDYVGSRICRF